MTRVPKDLGAAASALLETQRREEAAEKLGVSPRTLDRRIVEMRDLDPDDPNAVVALKRPIFWLPADAARALDRMDERDLRAVANFIASYVFSS